MAAIIHEQINITPPLSGFRISWGGIWAGVLTVIGTLLFLTTLGLAVGISAVEPGRTDAEAFGTGAAVWSGLSLLVALFIGGMAATRLGMVFDKAAGAFEGALVWVLSFLIVLWLASSGVRLIANGISGLFSGLGQTVQASVSGVDELSTGDVQQILARLNDPQTARTIASATGMSEPEVQAQLSQLAQRVQSVQGDPAAVAAEVREGTAQLRDRVRERLPTLAANAQEGATKAAWITFAAMVISLVAAIGGAMLGRRRVVATLAHPDAAAEIARAERNDDLR